MAWVEAVRAREYTPVVSPSGVETLSKHAHTWRGVECTPTNRIVKLSLRYPSRGYRAEVYAEIASHHGLVSDESVRRPICEFQHVHLTALTSLQVLDITRANLFGPLPQWLSEFRELRRLDLSHNFFSGTLDVLLDPTRESRLAHLALASNKITGTIPHLSRLPRIMHLDLRENRLTGSLSFPPSMANRTKHLQHLDLRSVQSPPHV
jgi:hypothetical protein